MNLLVVGGNHRTMPVQLRERIAIPEAGIPNVLTELLARFGGEAVVLSTCNRTEVYLADSSADRAGLIQFLTHDAITTADQWYVHESQAAAWHLFRVAAGLDSLVIGEGQIAGQIKSAYEMARAQAAAGPMLHALFQHARVVAKRVRRETGIAQGHASISSVAVDFIRQVFDHFADKQVLVIGAGKMGALTLKHLQALGAARIQIANRSWEKARETANQCGGQPVSWDHLDQALVHADIVLSTTGASEPIMSAHRFAALLTQRIKSPLVIIDIAVPRDFDPAIHDGDQVCLFNIDDLQQVRDQTLAERRKHVGACEAIAQSEAHRFVQEWTRRRSGPVIAKLTADFEAKRQIILSQLLAKLNGRLTDADKKTIEGAFRLLQNQFLHGPISALGEESKTGGGNTLLDAIRQLFRIRE
jgi:glutamyl-tRNA reductase